MRFRAAFLTVFTAVISLLFLSEKTSIMFNSLRYSSPCYIPSSQSPSIFNFAELMPSLSTSQHIEISLCHYISSRTCKFLSNIFYVSRKAVGLNRLSDKDSGKHGNRMPFQKHHLTSLLCTRWRQHTLLDQFPVLLIVVL